jgi:hypothetical protein
MVKIAGCGPLADGPLGADGPTDGKDEDPEQPASICTSRIAVTL